MSMGICLSKYMCTFPLVKLLCIFKTGHFGIMSINYWLYETFIQSYVERVHDIISLTWCKDHVTIQRLGTHPFNQTPIQPNTHSTKYPFNQTPIQPNTHSTKHPFNQTPIQPNTHSTKHPFNQTPIQLNNEKKIRRKIAICT